jgi:hypothetical protein
MASSHQSNKAESGADRLLRALMDFVKAPSWAASRRILDAHPELVSDAADGRLDLMIRDADAVSKLYPRLDGELATRLLQGHRWLLARCREVGVDQAFTEQTGDYLAIPAGSLPPAAPPLSMPATAVAPSRNPSGLVAGLVVAGLVVLLGIGIIIGTHDQGPGSAAGSQPLGTAAPAETAETAEAATSESVSGASNTPPANELASGATASGSATAPDNVDAGGTQMSYSASNVLDGDPKTAWRVHGNGRGVVLTLSLPGPAHLVQVGLIPGYAKIDPANGVDRFPQERRIAEVRWQFDDGTFVDQHFADSPTMQRTAVDVTTGSVTIRILATRPGDPDYYYTPISEVSLLGTS